MALTAEFSGGEFASFEFAIDPREYTDVEAVGSVRFTGACDTALAIGIDGHCSLEFIGDGSVGSFAGVVGHASLGVADEPDYTALFSSYGEGAIKFDGLAYQALIAEMSPAAALRWLASGATGYKIGVDATATLSFVSFAEPAGPEDAFSRWRWTGRAYTSARAALFGYSQLRFTAEGQVQGLTGLKAAASLRFTSVGRAGTWLSAPAYAMWRFAGSGRMRMVHAAQAVSYLRIDTKAIAASTARIVGIASLQFRATADGYARLIARTIGQGNLRFSAIGYTGIESEALSRLSFMGRAYTAVVESRSPLARLCFQSFAQPGAVILPYLPSSRTQFTVPERPMAFVVPPDAQLEEV